MYIFKLSELYTLHILYVSMYELIWQFPYNQQEIKMMNLPTQICLWEMSLKNVHFAIIFFLVMLKCWLFLQTKWNSVVMFV